MDLLYLGFVCIASLKVSAENYGFHEFDFLKCKGNFADFVDNNGEKLWKSNFWYPIANSTFNYLDSIFVAIVKSFGVIAIAIAALLAVAIAVVAKSAIVNIQMRNMDNLSKVDFENYKVVGEGGVA